MELNISSIHINKSNSNSIFIFNKDSQAENPRTAISAQSNANRLPARGVGDNAANTTWKKWAEVLQSPESKA